MIEPKYGEKKGVSGVRAWNIKKSEKHQCCIVNTKKKTLKYNSDKFWVRMITQTEIFIYPYPAPPEYTSEQLLEMLLKQIEEENK